MYEEARLRIFEPFETDLCNIKLNAADEIEAWIVRWKDVPVGQRPCSIPDVLSSATINSFPKIKVIFQVLAVIPVTTASVERIISLLRRLKPWLRSAMKNDRLNPLAHMLANPEIELDYEKNLKKWSKAKDRNIVLAFKDEDEASDDEAS